MTSHSVGAAHGPPPGGLGNCLLAAALFLACGCTAKTEPEPIVVGHVAPLSGADKLRGEHARLGIRLAVEEAEPIAGRRVAVDHADTRSDPEAVRAVVRRLLTVNRVSAVLGGAEAARVENLGALAQSNGVPFVLSGGPPLRPPAEFVFFTGMTPERQGQVLARFADRQWKGKTIAVLTDGNRAALVEAFTRSLPGSAVAGPWTYKGADKVRPTAEEVLAKKPEALLFAGAADDFAELGRSEAAAKVPVLFAGEEGNLGKLQTTPHPAAVYLATAFPPDAQPAAAKRFVEQYRQHFQDAPDAAAALAYDDARILFEAMRQARSTDGAKVRDALAAIRFDGVAGPVTFDKDHVAARTLFVVRLQGGKAETVQHFEPEEKATAAPAARTLAGRTAAR